MLSSSRCAPAAPASRQNDTDRHEPLGLPQDHPEHFALAANTSAQPSGVRQRAVLTNFGQRNSVLRQQSARRAGGRR